MNTRHCLKIADRMNALLLTELGQGVDGLRMVAEPLYARDVLLVCDAMPGTELAELARHFRVAATEQAQPRAEASPPAAGTGRDSTGAGSRQGKRSRTRGDSLGDSRGDTRGDTLNRTRPGTEPAAAADTGAPGSSGFGNSIWSRIASGFGFTHPGGPSSPDSQPAANPGAAGQPPQQRWFSPSRWRTGK
ncbi:MAG TPA: hypothetical protein VK876_08130 [Rubrivivax sp.]|nr:hypothetical protein [Rubrivivax sp.]